MREITRNIASAIIFSRDRKILMGKKILDGGGVFSDCYHIPGGGVEKGETEKEAMIREVYEEVGLDIARCKIKSLSEIGYGTSEKILKDTGEKVICNMKFNRFEVYIDENSNDIKLKLGGDLVEANWFSFEELKNVKQIPGGTTFFKKMGYMH